MSSRVMSLADPGTLRSRRAALGELAGMLTVLAVPIGAVIATARPIANPPDRDVIAALSPAKQDVAAARREAANASRRPAKSHKRDPERRRLRERRKEARQDRARLREERRRSREAT